MANTSLTPLPSGSIIAVGTVDSTGPGSYNVSYPQFTGQPYLFTTVVGVNSTGGFSAQFSNVDSNSATLTIAGSGLSWLQVQVFAIGTLANANE